MSELSKIREAYSAKDQLGVERIARQNAESDRNSLTTALAGITGVTGEMKKLEGKLETALSQVASLEELVRVVTNGKSQSDTTMAAMISDMKDMVNNLCVSMQAMKPLPVKPQPPAKQVPFDVVIERNEIGRMTNLKIEPRSQNGQERIL